MEGGQGTTGTSSQQTGGALSAPLRTQKGHFPRQASKHGLERDREGCSSGAKPLDRLTSAISRPVKLFQHDPDHGKLYHTFATAG